MSRREFVENIIIGTLLESTNENNYYTECSVLTPDMFIDQTNKEIFSLVSEMNRNGKNGTTPFDVYVEYGQDVAGIVPRMAELVCDFSFIHLKTQYNERAFLAGLTVGVDITPTGVEFSDYVNQFLRLVYEN